MGASYVRHKGVDAPPGIGAEAAHVSDVRGTVATMLHTGRWDRRGGHLTMTLGLVLLAVGFVLALMPAIASGATKQRRFVAWEDGQPRLPVKGRREMECAQSSYIAPRLDAWRCFGRSYLFDPCFENLAEEEFGELLCVSSPWDRGGYVALSGLDYDDRTRERKHPWALVLASGRRCRFLGGGTAVSRGRRLNYACGRRGPFVYGLPDRSRLTWRVFVARGGFEARGWHREKVRVAWY